MYVGQPVEAWTKSGHRNLAYVTGYDDDYVTRRGQRSDLP